ncbi:hypothetical protein NE237_005903 [Protea cynaroides]|uniref:Uncharacterized protein n=1 Tax=Protea cynaroides TaxID=273540 RepID=A0A9Q0KM29_9MAGN|nr:hypothetical protein NE237_005903 [Protea cynaroides]
MSLHFLTSTESFHSRFVSFCAAEQVLADKPFHHRRPPLASSIADHLLLPRHHRPSSCISAIADPPTSSALRPPLASSSIFNPLASSSIFNPLASPVITDRCRHPEWTGCFERSVDFCSCNSNLNEKSQEVIENLTCVLRMGENRCVAGKEIVPYMGLASPISIHRYVFALFQQRGGGPVSGKFDHQMLIAISVPAILQLRTDWASMSPPSILKNEF